MKKEGGFDEENIGAAQLSIRFHINAHDVKEDDSLDHLLSQLSKKIFSLGYGTDGTFDVRFEKGFLPLEGESFQWHYDGEIFKTSITVCFSNKKNWSTRIQGDRPAEHGFLYDALQIYHRAPLPADLKDEELTPNDYRLFIRYTEFHPEYQTPLSTPEQESKAPSIVDFLKTEYLKNDPSEPKQFFDLKPLKIKNQEMNLEDLNQMIYLKFKESEIQPLDFSKLIEDSFKVPNTPKEAFTPLLLEIPKVDSLNLVVQNLEAQEEKEPKKKNNCIVM